VHSLLGLAPIGVFLILHLTTNVMIVFNTPEHDHFQDKVDLIHSLEPVLVPVEIVGIFLPLAFHAGLGVKIWLEGRPNSSAYPYLANWRYMLQRVTGVIALIFILVHVWHMHWLGERFGGSFFDPDNASATAASALQESRWWASPLYAIGILAACYHFANGIWTSLITWGITIGKGAQRKAGYACAVIGVALACTGLAAMNGFMEYPDAAPKSKFESKEGAAESDAAPAEPGVAMNEEAR
jgi:succinate dehydrogenase / fumarate reductase cytochrome b subunit